MQLSSQELMSMLQDWSATIPVWSIRYHWKKKDVLYTVTDLVIDEPTDTVAVVYKQSTTGICFVRLASVFVENVQYDKQTSWPRFIETLNNA